MLKFRGVRTMYECRLYNIYSFLKLGGALKKRRPGCTSNFTHVKLYSERSSAMIVAMHQQFFKLVLAACDMWMNAASNTGSGYLWMLGFVSLTIRHSWLVLSWQPWWERVWQVLDLTPICSPIRDPGFYWLNIIFLTYYIGCEGHH